jgi:hypothetical protein
MDTVRQVPTVIHHPKSPNASLEALRRLAGIVSLTGSVSKADIFEDEETEDLDSARPTERAGD